MLPRLLADFICIICVRCVSIENAYSNYVHFTVRAQPSNSFYLLVCCASMTIGNENYKLLVALSLQHDVIGGGSSGEPLLWYIAIKGRIIDR